MQTRSKSGISKKKIFSTTCTPNYLQTEPPTYKIASQTPEWCATMASEFEALQRQSTWSLVPSSPAQNVIGCRWFYKIKRNTDSSVSWYKARLVAKGFHQQAGVDYVETFSSVVKPPTIHIILSLAAQNRWSLCQLDESNAFLHGLLKESVFMAQLVGFVDQDHPSHLGPLTLIVFMDADWARDPSDRRSTSGITMFLGNNPITWMSKKQHTVSCSSIEAEYRSLATGAVELAWLHQVICDLGLYLASAPIIGCDNTNALALASNPVFHGRTKHIEVDYHFIRERVVRGDISLQFISIDDQVADIFTKALPSPRFHRLCSKLLVCSTDHYV
uniref:Reverse transcriptase Ty1/copia-type domain-containing protein n=1 Tax=Fagus sylvatica TaxID=28930 RepID=A0A2N9GIC3_FAGSY